MANEKRSRMKLGPAVALAVRLEREFLGVVRTARDEGRSHDWILEQRNHQIQQHKNWHRLPQYLQAQVMRYTSGVLDGLHVTDAVKWQLYLDGERVESADVPNGRWGDVSGSRFEWAHSGATFLERKGK